MADQGWSDLHVVFTIDIHTEPASNTLSEGVYLIQKSYDLK